MNRPTYVAPVTDCRGNIYLPIETALGRRDEVVSLLAALGADVDAPIKSSTVTYMQRLSFLQWTSKAISILGCQTVPKPIQAPHNLPDSPAGDTWNEYRAFVAGVLPHRKLEDIGYVGPQGLHQVRNIVRTLDGEPALAMKEYLTYAESVLRAHGATLPEGASISEQLTPAVTYQGSGYLRHGKNTTKPVPVHLKVFYDELYEACWKGDNASIQELCLPKQVVKGKEPIQIVVQTKIANDCSLPSGALLVSVVHETVCLADIYFIGWTPFLVALHRRHWDTAWLVLAIATAQYQPPDNGTTKPTLHGKYPHVPASA